LKSGFFGGTFDPIHHGHLIAAQDALEQLELETVHFVPTAQSPLRDDAVRAGPEHRLEMIRRAVAGDSRFQVSDVEIARGGVSYTYDTVCALRKEQPERSPIWIIGEDQVGKLPRWHRIEELCRLTEFAFLARPDHTQPTDPELPELRLHRLRSHQVQISSTEIRRRVREKRPLRFLLPDPVIQYIHEHNLYR
jgi:nicotinate-nucleotide adenylyltransferase